MLAILAARMARDLAFVVAGLGVLILVVVWYLIVLGDDNDRF